VNLEDGLSQPNALRTPDELFYQCHL